MRILFTVLAPAILIGLFPSHALATNDPSTNSLPVIVPDEDLEKMRGGFVWSGLDINFGAEIRTYVNGDLVLRTLLNWTDDGPITEQTAADGLSPVDIAALDSGILSTGSIRMKVGDTPVYLLNEGKTAILHGTENGVQNMLINTANGFDSVQEVDATLSLSGYGAFSSDLMRDRVASALGDAAGQGAIGSLGF